LGEFLGQGLNSHVQNSQVNVDVSVLLKGFNDPADGITRMVEIVEGLVKETLRPSLRLTSGIKNVVLNSMAITPFNLENDNLIVAELTFGCLVILEIPT
jgi:hypothetical protein